MLRQVPAGSVRPVGGFRTEAMAQAEVDQLGDPRSDESQGYNLEL